jgi:pimeloyl-ACP methyl ester carboxylesterase
LAAQLAFAQPQPSVQGNWLGTLDAGAVKLRLALKVVAAADGALSATLDSLDQGASDLPVTALRQNGADVEFELVQIGGFFRGALRGDTLAGTWRQGPGTLPLIFRRVDKASELVRPQLPKKPYPYDEEDVTYQNKVGRSNLAGTLTLPRGASPFPVVLLITGSGQQDRDQSLMGHKPFLVLADHLTRKGIAVLRVDDRGVGKSTGEVATATSEDFAGDVLAGVEFLKSRGRRIDPKRIGLIGHSEGGVIAPIVATRSSDVAFLVMMAGTGVTGEANSYAQAAAISKASGVSTDAILRNRLMQQQVLAIVKEESDLKARQTKLRALATKLSAQMPSAANELATQFEMSATPWFRYFAMYDPASTLSKVKCPVLALGGELDLQVPADLNLPAIERALKAGGNSDITVTKLPRLNHLFQTSQTGNPTEYGTIQETIAPVALETISGWILKHTAR